VALVKRSKRARNGAYKKSASVMKMIGSAPMKKTAASQQVVTVEVGDGFAKLTRAALSGRLGVEEYEAAARQAGYLPDHSKAMLAIAQVVGEVKR
jgi:hypothetical protein